MVTHGPENYKSEFEREFELEDDEFITKVFVKYHITFILTLKFKTNFGKESLDHLAIIKHTHGYSLEIRVLLYNRLFTFCCIQLHYI